MNKILKPWIGVTFVMKSTLTKMCALETIATSLEIQGSAHQECNLKLRIKPENIKIPVIFHNLCGYDSHFIMQQIGEIANKHGYIQIKKEKRKTSISMPSPIIWKNIWPLC